MRYDTRFWRGGLNLFYALLIVAASSGLRIAFLGGLGRGVAYLTYYPAVMVAAIIGGLGAGILATLASALLAWLWIQGGLLSSVEWLALGVFLLSCTMISFMAESMRRANLRALKAKEEAEAASRSKSTFLANMSHELRTPLNAVLGFSSLMRKDSSMHGRNLDYLGIINRSGSHLLNLINNILDISKIEAGRVELEPSDVDLAQLLREVGEMLRFRAREKGLELVVDTNDLPRTVRLDQGKLRQILINLTGNAIQYTRRGRSPACRPGPPRIPSCLWRNPS